MWRVTIATDLWSGSFTLLYFNLNKFRYFIFVKWLITPFPSIRSSNIRGKRYIYHRCYLWRKSVVWLNWAFVDCGKFYWLGCWYGWQKHFGWIFLFTFIKSLFSKLSFFVISSLFRFWIFRELCAYRICQSFTCFNLAVSCFCH